MGTQGLSGRKVAGGWGTRRTRLTSMVMSIAIWPALAGCSSWSNPYQTVSAPPPPASPSAVSQAGYPPPPGPAVAATAPPPQEPPTQPGSAASLKASYVSFLEMFRDPPEPAPPAPAPPAYAAPQRYTAPAAASSDDTAANAYPYPKQSLVDVFRGSTESAPPQPPPPAGTPLRDSDQAASGYPYPKQSLFSAFRGSSDSSSSAQTAVPHPPNTYTPAGQPYSPPPGQQTYNPPPGATSAGAAPAAQAPQANADSSGAYPYPKQSLFDIFSNKPAAQ